MEWAVYMARSASWRRICPEPSGLVTSSNTIAPATIELAVKRRIEHLCGVRGDGSYTEIAVAI
jgi:hypothetical protein